MPQGIRAIAILDRGLLTRLVLGPHIATIDGQAAVPIQRDEDAFARDLGLIVNQRPLLECLNRPFELTKPGIDLVGILILARVFLLQCAVLGEECHVGRAFHVGHQRGITGQTPQTVAVAIG